MSGFHNEIMYADNVDFSGSTSPSKQVTANGQLLIGSTVAPNIRVNTLTAGTGITVTNGAGSITIDASAATPLVFHTDSGDATPAANAVTVAGGVGCSTSGSGSTITVTVSGAGFDWTDELLSYSAVADNGYVSQNTVTGTLPAAGAANGTTIAFKAGTTHLHTIQPSTTDKIRIGNSLSTNGTGSGKIVSTLTGDALTLVYNFVLGEWDAQNVVGNWTIV